jgi:hypothetical protein
MSLPSPIPFFPVPPAQYDPRYFAELTRAFSVFAQQVNTPGPWRATELTLTQSTGNVEEGVLSWGVDDETLDLTMGNGVVQQIGFETYMRVKNDTGSLIPNGTVVGFSGVNGEIKVAPYIANSSANELYFVGVTTCDIPDQAVRPVTLYGKVRGLDTSGFSVGDILYASPSTAGALTSVRPTAPNVVLPVAAVLSVNATTGEIMVRPTIPMGLDYGAFSSTATQTLAAIDTATAITLNTTSSSNGVTLTSGSRLNAAQSGFYSVSVSLQLTSTSSSAKTVYVWLRKNGSDVADSTRAFTSDVNNGYTPISVTYPISLVASDYVEVYWAADSTAVALDAITASGFAPSAPSAIISVTQIQL